MKSLLIKNRTTSPLIFAFCTKSRCRCDVCEEWIECETKPIGGSFGATFGILIVDAFAERVDRFCPRWDCVGACFFDAVPTFMTMDMFFDYDEGASYTIGNGKAEFSFTHQPNHGDFSNGALGSAVLGGAATGYRMYEGAQFVGDVLDGYDEGRHCGHRRYNPRGGVRRLCNLVGGPRKKRGAYTDHRYQGRDLRLQELVGSNVPGLM